MHIELIHGGHSWWRIVAANGEIVAASQLYRTKWSARRSAKRIAKANGYRIVEKPAP